MARENREPDVDGIQTSRLPNYQTDPERDEYLGNDRDVERALGIAGPLQPPGVGQRNRHEQS